MVTSTLFSITYGKKILDTNHEYVVAAQMSMEGIGHALVPGGYWVELFPFLRHIPGWIPGTGAKRLANKFGPYVTASRDKPFKEVQMAAVCVSLLTP